MGTQRTIIELNGKKYDASTGEIIGSSADGLKTKRTARRIVDGVWGKNKKAAQPTPKVSTTVLNKPAHKPAPNHRQVPQRAKTLMRSTVKSPASESKARVFDIARRPNAKRQQRAQATSKSSLIERFNTPATVIKKAGSISRAAFVSGGQSAVATLRVQPAVNSIKDRLESALQRATAHEEKPPAKPHLLGRIATRLGIKPRTLAISISALGVLVVSSFLVYQNLPKFAIRVAAAKAGFHASLPSYIPSGFSVSNQISSTSGKILVNFHSNSDTRAYSLTEQPSQWNSDSLLNNYVTTAKKPYQTFQNNGKTIYIYDVGNATWVDGGIWYKVESSNSLNSDQLLKIADSI